MISSYSINQYSTQCVMGMNMVILAKNVLQIQVIFIT